MTAAAPASGAPPAATAVSPDTRRLWRRGRGPLLALVVLVLTSLVLGLLRSAESGALDPRSATEHGSLAVAELLAEHGVRTTLAASAAEAAEAAGPDSTLLVVGAEALTPGVRNTLRSAPAGRTVLVAPGPRAVAALAPEAGVAPPVPAGELTPQCADPAARRAGSTRLGGFRFDVPASSGATACYPADGLPTLVTLPGEPDGAGDATGETVLLGAPDILYNRELSRLGNASLALQLLGAHRDLVWYLPTPGEAPADEDTRSLTDLADPGWRWGALQLALAAVLAALWRGRRLGGVVTERLPVPVRAAETTEGRARLYHRAGARDRAAEALRAAARTRLAPLVGLGAAAAHSAEALTPAAAAHASEEAVRVHALLFGPPPADDAGLVLLADELDALHARIAPAAPAAGTTPPPRENPSP